MRIVIVQENEVIEFKWLHEMNMRRIYTQNYSNAFRSG